ncbi:MAG: hypothetical protein GC159_09145 [Phycisphaera sp.]|nr:hypothetical protein [Phycisphaera sp.]
MFEAVVGGDEGDEHVDDVVDLLVDALAERAFWGFGPTAAGDLDNLGDVLDGVQSHSVSPFGMRLNG